MYLPRINFEWLLRTESCHRQKTEDRASCWSHSLYHVRLHSDWCVLFFTYSYTNHSTPTHVELHTSETSKTLQPWWLWVTFWWLILIIVVSWRFAVGYGRNFEGYLIRTLYWNLTARVSGLTQWHLILFHLCWFRNHIIHLYTSTFFWM